MDGSAMAWLDAGALERLARLHGPHQERLAGGPLGSVETMARLLTELSGGRVVAVPAGAACRPSSHPLEPDIRIVHDETTGEAACERHGPEGWSPLHGVHVRGRPDIGFWIDGEALEAVLGSLGPELRAALVRPGRA